MHRTFLLAGAFAFILSATIPAQTPVDTVVYLVAYVDVMPSGKSAAVSALKAYRDASAQEMGHVRIDLFEQVGRPGHFAVVEAWRDQSALGGHAGGAAAKQFHLAIDKVRVSGYDQRPYKPLNVGRGRSASGPAVHVVSHVDIGGGGAGLAGAPAMLGQLAEASRSEQGNLRFDVLQHAMRANHFTVVESWATQAALDAHAAASHTRQYRETLQPISGSPLDERVYLAIE
jgi:quinol monooxygenase YgiN